METHQDISPPLPVGNRRSIDIALTGGADATDPTSLSWELYAFPYTAGAVALITKTSAVDGGITINSSTSLTVTLKSSDTLTLDAGTYYHCLNAIFGEEPHDPEDDPVMITETWLTGLCEIVAHGSEYARPSYDDD